MTKVTKDPSAADYAGMLGNMPFNPMNDPRFKLWSDLGAEMMQFASSRIQQDMEAQKAMMACKSFEELQKLQAQYYSEAIKDYTAQIQRSMAALSGAATKQADGLVTPTKRGYDDVPV